MRREGTMGATLFDLLQDSLGQRYGEGLRDAVVVGAVEGEDTPSDALVAWLGGEAVRLLAERYPSVLGRHGSVRSFLRSLPEEIPAAVGEPPSGPGVAFDYEETLDGELLVGVRGAGRVCAFLQGVVSGLAVHYRERLRLSPLKCACRGDNRCVLQLATAAPVDAPASVEWSGARARLA